MADSTVKISITADIMEAQASLSVLKQKLKDLVKTQQESLDTFDGRSEKMTEAQKKSFESFQTHLTDSINKVKNSISGAIEKIDELKGEDLGTGLKDNIENTTGALSKMGNMLKTAFVYDMAFQAINKLEDALKGLLTSSINVSGQFEQMQIGIAAVISASSSNVSSIDQLSAKVCNGTKRCGRSDASTQKSQSTNSCNITRINRGIPIYSRPSS
jgi:chromosome segregation ATPase